MEMFGGLSFEYYYFHFIDNALRLVVGFSLVFVFTTQGQDPLCLVYLGKSYLTANYGNGVLKWLK